MRQEKVFAYSIMLLSLVFLSTSCGVGKSSPSGGSQGGRGQGTPAGVIGTAAAANVVPLSLGAGTANQVSVSLTICVPNTNNCKVIKNLLLDTGSTGVRIFASALGGVYPSLTKTGLVNCTSYADNSYDWGPVVTADVVLGQEKASAVPVQVIDAAYADNAQACVAAITSNNSKVGITADPYPDLQGVEYNGIVGLNFLLQDCGSLCTTDPANGVYFTCNESTCTGSVASLAQQMTNPISKLSHNSNGISISFPSINSVGADAAAGEMKIGIGTQTNNIPAEGIKTLTANPNEQENTFSYFTTRFEGNQYVGFIDSGSGCLAFPYANAELLPEDHNGSFVPNTPVSLTATQVGHNNVENQINFTVAAWNDFAVQPQCGDSLGAGSSFASYDFNWGLPFFLGRTVYIGLEGASSSLGSGLYWAY